MIFDDISFNFVSWGYVRNSDTIHKAKYQIHSRTIIHFGQTHVINILSQYAKNINK
jgi:hypothetical protein